MFKIAVVVFRECLEIAFLFGVIMAVTRPVKNSRPYIILGSVVGVVLAATFALFARKVSHIFGGLGDEIFDSSVILLTSAMISWTVVWMQGYTRKIKKDLGKLSDKITTGATSQFMLVVVVATAILREGTEIILFVYTISSAEKIEATNYIIGLGIGSFAGLAVGSVLYLGLIKYAGKYIFTISTVLLTLIAAGLSAQAAGILTSSGIIESFNVQLWDSSWLVEDRSFIGKILNITTGYASKPNGLQIIFYLATIGLITGMMKIRAILTSKKYA